MKVLYIEDNPNNMSLVEKILRATGYEMIGAENGELGLLMAETHQPQLVLLDINLPDVDGYEIARRLRASEQTAVAQVPIVAVTANALVGDDQKAIEAGCNDYLPKPINIRELRACVARHLSIT